MDKRVIIAHNRRFELDGTFHAAMERFQERGLEPVIVPMTDPGPDELIAAAEGFGLALDVGCDWTEPTLKALAGKLLAISIPAAGYDNVDIPAATAAGVAVMNSPGLSGPSVAEHALGLMLCAARNIVRLDRRMRAGYYDSDRTIQLTGKTVGIVGFGVIGRQLAKLLTAFGCRLLVYSDPRDEAAAKELGARFVPLETLLRESDFVSLHLPLTPDTRGMIGRREFAMMKRTAVLVNTARGGVVDEEALTEALRDGVIAAAGLDVLVKEPPEPANPILTLENVVLTPHSASHVPELRDAINRRCIENLLCFAGGSPRNVVNPEYVKRTAK